MREVVEVEKKLTAWQEFKMKCGAVAIIAFALVFLWLALYHKDGNKWECISNRVQVRGISEDHKKVWDYRPTNITYEAE